MIKPVCVYMLLSFNEKAIDQNITYGLTGAINVYENVWLSCNMTLGEINSQFTQIFPRQV